jgi:O-succinylbenzoic acid--CoA ligase
MSFSIESIHRSISKQEILPFSRKLCRYMQDRTSSSQILAIQAHTNPETVLVMASCLYAGIPFVSLNPNLELDIHRKHLKGIIPVTLWIDAEPTQTLDRDILSIELFLAKLKQLPEADPSPTDPSAHAVMLATSGSTGEPKWLGFNQAQLQAAAEASKQALKPSPDGAWLLNLPLNHVGGLGILVRSLLWDTPIVVDARKDPESILELLREYPQIEHLSLVPTQLHRILEAGGAKDLASLSNILVGAGSLSKADLEIVNRYRLPVRQSYGMTETFGHVTVSPKASEFPLHISDCGKPLPGIELITKNGDSGTSEATKEGTIWLKGAQIAKYYIGQSTSSQDDWFNTNDIGYLSPKGSLVFVGRTQHIIKSGGYSIPATKVEESIRQFENIQDVAVIGVEDSEWGERVHACIEVKTDAPLDVVALNTFLRDHLSGAEVPKTLSIHKEFPRSTLGKISYPQLQELLRNYPIKLL